MFLSARESPETHQTRGVKKVATGKEDEVVRSELFHANWACLIVESTLLGVDFDGFVSAFIFDGAVKSFVTDFDFPDRTFEISY